MFIARGEKFTKDKVAKSIPDGMFWTSTEKYGFSFTEGKKFPFRLILKERDREKYKNPKLQEQLKERAIQCIKNNEDRIWKAALKFLEDTKHDFGEEAVLSKPEIETPYYIERAYDYDEWTVGVTFEVETIKEHGYEIWVRLSDNAIVRNISGSVPEWPPVQKYKKPSKEAFDINRAASENFIKSMINSGRIAVAEAAEDEFNDELDDTGEPTEDDIRDPFGDGDTSAEDEAFEDIGDYNEFENTEIDNGDSGFYEEPVEEEPKEVEKVHTIDTISQITNKFDQYMADIGIDWTPFIQNGRIKKAANFKYIEDLRTHLNKLFDEKEFRYVEIFNKYYDFLTDTNMAKAWNLFGRENMGKPYLAEGAALLMYELAVEWVPVIVRYYKESPTFSKDIRPEEDSFFKAFPHLNDLTYIAAIIVENKEFKKLITSDKSRELLQDESKYQLTAQQAKSKPSLRGLGESLSYYAGLVKENFGDITAGALDKFAILAFWSKNTKMPMNDRLNLIDRLIKIVTANTTPSTDPNAPDPLMQALDVLNQSCTELVKNRAEARITLESNERNYPSYIVEKK